MREAKHDNRKRSVCQRSFSALGSGSVAVDTAERKDAVQYIRSGTVAELLLVSSHRAFTETHQSTSYRNQRQADEIPLHFTIRSFAARYRTSLGAGKCTSSLPFVRHCVSENNSETLLWLLPASSCSLVNRSHACIPADSRTNGVLLGVWHAQLSSNVLKTSKQWMANANDEP